jgi:hypothetical protein
MLAIGIQIAKNMTELAMMLIFDEDERDAKIMSLSIIQGVLTSGLIGMYFWLMF